MYSKVSLHEDSSEFLETHRLQGSLENDLQPEIPVKGSIVQTLFFTWFQPLIITGNERLLTKKDLLRLPRCLESKEVYLSLLKCLRFEELRQDIDKAGYEACPNHNYNYSNHHNHHNSYSYIVPVKLWKALYCMIYRELWYSGICRLWSDIAVVLGSYYIQQIIISAQNKSFFWAFLYAWVILFNSVIQAILLQQFIHGSFMSGSRVVAATTALVYHSSLALRLHKMNPPKSIGEINNIQAKDSSSLREFVVFFHNLWACPLMIVLCVGYLLFLLGWAGVVCCALLPLLIPLENYIANRARKIRKSVLEKSDKRMSSINELIDGIWTVKLTGLCPLIYEKISKLRDDELLTGWKSTLIEMINLVITRSSTLLITLTTFLVYILIYPSSSLTADRVFTALSLINILGRPLQVIPKCVSLLSDAFVSSDRIESIMIEAIKFDRNLFDINKYTTRLSSLKRRSVPILSSSQSSSQSLSTSLAIVEPMISMNKVTALRYPDAIPVLNSITWSQTGPSFIIITGSNASGKSTLLLSILKELEIESNGKIITDSGNTGIAYCGHDSWILNKTAKENILLASSSSFPSSSSSSHDISMNHMNVVVVDMQVENNHDGVGQVFDANYEHAVELCALTKDFASWENADQTLIGERGINISGGQKQRLSLARAIASSAKILLLDSILSGLDVRIAHEVMESIKSESKSRLIVLATSQQEWLPYADRIIHLSKGRIVYDGSYSEYQHLQDLNTELSNTDLSSSKDKTSTKSKIVLSFDSLSTISAQNSSSGSHGDSNQNTVTTKSKGSNHIMEGSITTDATITSNNSNSSNSNSNKKSVSDSSKEKFTKSTNDKTMDIIKETRTWKTYIDYVYACGAQNIGLAILLSFVAYGSGAFADTQTAKWTDGSYSDSQFLVIYTFLSTLVVLLNLSRYFMYGYSGQVASRYLHSKLLQAMLGSTFAFYHSVPSGRITSRFSVDFDTIDFSIPSSISSLADALLGILTGIGVVVYSSPIYVVFIIPLIWLYYYFQSLYRNVSKELKKLESAAKSPLFSHFRETLGGLETIRGYRIEDKMIKEHFQLLDDSIVARLNWDAANRWLGIRLDLIGSMIVSVAAFSLLLSLNGSGGQAGLMITYALKATNSLSFAIRSSTALENMFTSPERVMEYIHVEQETGPTETPLHGKIPSRESSAVNSIHNSLLNSSHACVLSGLNVVARYGSNTPQVLKGIDFEIYAGKLVGICGRTGCGKSTLSILLSRGLPHYTGRILYMGNDLSSTSLAAYRALVISVYPQDSYIFSGTIRDFLDPFHMFEDRKLNYVLNELIQAMNIDLILPASKQGISDNQRLALDSITGPGGNNLSAGQKQVIVFARAALATTKVVILDEITSNMDPNAAKRAIEIVKEELTKRDVAVVMIAHSMNDIAMCDEVWVMSAGKIVETGSPTELMNRTNGEFASMWQMHISNQS